MNKNLGEAIKVSEHNQIDFHKLLYWHLCFGVVVSDIDSFCLGFYSNSEDVETACEIHHSDTLFVTMHSGDMRKALEKFRHDFQYIAFRREFKGSPQVRVHPMDSFYSRLK
jgi:hypothetical protein